MASLGTGDTAARSLSHWSEQGRAEMEAFYALARLDYKELAGALDYPALLHGVAQRAGTPGSLTLLDVACGSGKFPEALLTYAGVDGLELRIDYDLLDPSAFSLSEAASVLREPFVAGERYESTLEDLDPAAGPWDVVWATHALYAIEPEHVAAGAQRFLAAIAPHGVGLVAQGSHDGHYLRFYRRFLDDLHGGEGTMYRASEDIAGALREAGAQPEVRRLRYTHTIDAEQRATVEGYLQRCAFDDGVSLDQMLAGPTLGPYLEACLDEAAGLWRFEHEVDLILIGQTR